MPGRHHLLCVLTHFPPRFFAHAYESHELTHIHPLLRRADGITWHDCESPQALIKGKEGQEIKCRVEADPAPDISWMKDGNFPDPNRYSLTESGIRINGYANDSDGGSFVMHATVLESGSLEMKELVVQVHTKPVITDIAEAVDVVEGESAELRCSAQATPYAEYDWTGPNDRDLASNSNG